LGRLATLALRRALYASEHVKQRTLGQEPTGRRSILTSHLVHHLPRNQRTRTLTRSNLAVYLIQTRLPGSTAKRECSAGRSSAEGPRSKHTTKRLASKRHKLQESYHGKYNSLKLHLSTAGFKSGGTRCSLILIGASQCFVATRSKSSPTLDLATHTPEQVIRNPIRWWPSITLYRM
jgi:hypothetical protein